MALHVVHEAQRCLNCKVPQCKKGCPIHTPIPEMIQTFLNHRIEDAGRLLFENNPLSVICSLVCDHDKQCEGHCVLRRKGAPVHISAIENYISENYLDRYVPEKYGKNGMRAAIIGAGPAGLTIAVILAGRGYDVTVFDSKSEVGGVLRYGIPEFRLPKSLLTKYEDKLRVMGVQIRPNTTIGGVLSLDRLFDDGYRAVFIGTGVWRPKGLGIPGESLGNVHYAIDYLVSPDTYHLGENVAILGAGNSAMDVARTVMRHGARHVSVFSRRDETAASSRETEYAMADGVEIVYRRKAVKITPEGPVLIRTEADGTGSYHPLEGTEELFMADSTIIAAGQGPKDKIVSTTSGLEVNSKGLLVTDESGSTTRDGVFASGDVVLGARTVVEAVAYSKIVADEMDCYMKALK